MLARGQARFSSEKCGVIDLNQHGFCQIRNRQTEKTVNIGKKGLTSAAHWQIKRPVLVHRQNALAQNLCGFRGHSSAGRAPALQAGGRRFDPVWLHQITLKFHWKLTLAMIWCSDQSAFICCACYFRTLAIRWCLNRAGKIMQRICLQQRFQLLHLLVNCGSVYGSTLS